MSVREMYNYGRDNGLFSDALNGKSPSQTMKSKLSVHIRSRGAESEFVRTAPGRFYLREFLEEDGKEPYESKPWQPPPSNEIVTVFHNSELDKFGRFQGIRQDFRRTYDGLFRTGVCSPMDRSQAEADDEHKQVLTYILVRKGNRYLCYERGTYNRTEDMLRGLSCVGFGGHVNAEDIDLFAGDDAGILRAAARELSEELALPRADQIRVSKGEGLQVVGLLNDDSSAVGRRHFAVLLRYDVSDDPSWDNPAKGENSINQLRWIGSAGEVISLEKFEYWSQLTLRMFAPRVVRAQPSRVMVRRNAFNYPHLMCVVGPIGSGKTEAAQLVRDEFGYTELNSGRILASLMNVPPVPDTPRQDFQDLAQAYISQPSGPRELAVAIAERVSESGGERIILDGLRHRRTLYELRALVPIRVNVVYIYTPPDVAYKQYRAREDRSIDFLEFAAISESSVESDITSMLGDADAVIYNWGQGKETYLSMVRGFIGELLSL